MCPVFELFQVFNPNSVERLVLEVSNELVTIAPPEPLAVIP
jgi:hypothetical protein